MTLAVRSQARGEEETLSRRRKTRLLPGASVRASGGGAEKAWLESGRLENTRKDRGQFVITGQNIK